MKLQQVLSAMAEEVDNFEIIRDGLTTFGGMQKQAGEWRMVCCPFHADKTPSCGVYQRRDNPRRPLGYFNCLGCGTKGEWNVFAEKTGLPTIKSWNSKEKESSYSVSRLENALLGDTGLTLRSVYKTMGCPEAQPWPVELDWRGFKGELIASVGGKVVNDEYNDSLAVLFPIKISNKVRGAVKAVYVKKFSKQLSYITMQGEWVSSYGLFPYDHVKQMIRRNGYSFVILVEGPRDALRLIKLGFPAIAVLGANTMSKTKMTYITSLGIDTMYVMADNDNGGSKMWSNVKHAAQLPVRRLKLPREYDADNKIIKMDPFSAPASLMREVKVLMRERHGWVKEQR